MNKKEEEEKQCDHIWRHDRDGDIVCMRCGERE